MEKKKIIIDLDVVTVGIWKKSDERKVESINFMNMVKAKEFEVAMLSSTLNLVEKWDNIELSISIKEFYSTNTNHFIDDLEIFSYLKKNKISASAIIGEFLRRGIKLEDIMLILGCSAVKAEYLVTFNRKHLMKNAKIINEILSKNKLNKIRVVHPNEI